MSNKVKFAIFYLGLIPAFACVYLFLSNDFYHATVQHESSIMNKEAQSILDGLQENISQRIAAVKNSTSCDPWHLDRGLRVHSFRPEGEKVNFEVSGVLATDVQGHVEYYFNNRFSFLLNQRMVTITPGGSASVGFFLKSEDPMPIQSPVAEINLQRCLFPVKDLYSLPLEIPEPLYRRIASFSSASRGFPAHLPGQFFRMLYLSATTITTLGFGDIVPLTTRARMAVSSESILGIVLMGLFVNAVSAERKSEKEASQPTPNTKK